MKFPWIPTKGGTARKSPWVIFVTGTDTGVGKTHIACQIIRKLRKGGRKISGLKPICCGDREDALQLWKASGKIVPLDTINPIHLPQPLAPSAQARPTWKAFVKKVSASLHAMKKQDVEGVIIEGAGGWLCPYDTRHTLADLAEHFRWPVLIVAANRLGVLNHTLLTLESIQRSRCTCTGVILNSIRKSKIDLSQTGNYQQLKKRFKVSVTAYP